MSGGNDALNKVNCQKLAQLFTGPIDFSPAMLQLPAGTPAPPSRNWKLPQFDKAWRGEQLFRLQLGYHLRKRYDGVCHFSDTTHFLTPLGENIFDRMRYDGAAFAYRAQGVEATPRLAGVVSAFNYDPRRWTILADVSPKTAFRHVLKSFFYVAQTSLWDQDVVRRAVIDPARVVEIWHNGWSADAVLTAVLSKTQGILVERWNDFIVGVGDPTSPRYRMAAGEDATLLPPAKWGRNYDGTPKTTGVAARVYRGRHQPPLPETARKKALVVIGDGLGNVIEQTPLVKAVSSMFQETHVWLPRSRPDVVEMLRDMPGVSSVQIQFPSEFTDISAAFSTWLVTRELRKHKLKCPLYAANSPLNRKRSEAAVCLDSARHAGWAGDMPPPYVGYDEWQHPIVPEHDGPIIGLTTGRLNQPTWRFKEYAPERYAQVVTLLDEHLEGRAMFVQCGWRHDLAIPHDKVIDTRNVGTLRETLGLISRFSFMLGNDTGLCHASAALGVPTLVVFGPTSQDKCLPPQNAAAVSLGLPCQPCQPTGLGRYPDTRQPCRHECMKKLPAEKVFAAAINLYKERVTNRL
jgi:hypothetical protein